MASCSSIGDVVDPVERCKLALEFCQQNTIIPFGELVYCGLQSTFARLLLLILCTMWLFGAIGVAAFDHLSPNLTYVAEVSGLSQTLMGVTVLAFGNGSVDVFGALVALNANEGAMAFGEIMGGALFVVSVVIGSMAIVNPIVVDRRLFVRDGFVLAFCAFFNLVIVSDGVITITEALAGLALYISYGVIAVRQHLRWAREDVYTDDEIQNTELESATESPMPEAVPMAHPSLISSLELNRKVNKHLNEAQLEMPSPIQSPFIPAIQVPPAPENHHQINDSIAEPSCQHMRRRSSAPDHINIFEPPQIVLTAPVSHLAPENSAQIMGGEAPRQKNQRLLLSPINTNFPPQSYDCDHVDVLRDAENNTPLLVTDLVERLLEPHQSSREQTPIDVVEEPSATKFCTMFPFAKNWTEQGLIQRISNLLLAPFTTLLAWSIPTAGLGLVSLCMYSVGIPLALPIVTTGVWFSNKFVAVQTVLSASGLFCWGVLRLKPPPPLLLGIVGFMMALLWVMYLATELVTVLTLLGTVSHVSSTLMGLTVFAVGDSLGDFVANVTVAQIGYSAMAIAACFGGPIFTLLIGISGASLTAMLNKQQLKLAIPPTRGIYISTWGLIAVLAFLLVSVVRNEYVITKRTGVLLIMIWFLTVLLSAIFSS